ncbi:MAG: uroporphyrinogen-III synthase [Nitrososphaera sp.]
MSGLKGKVLAITRSKKDAEEFSRLVSAEGGTTIALPTVEIVPRGRAAAKQFIDALQHEKHDFCAFMSAQAVHVLTEMAGSDLVGEALRHTRVIAIGPKTRAELEKLRVRVDSMPSEYSTKGMVSMLSEMMPSGKKIIIPRSAAANDSAANALRSLGMQVDEVMLYTVRASKASKEWKQFAASLRNGKIDAIIFTSASSVESFFEVLGRFTDIDTHLDQAAKVISIGSSTTEPLKKRKIECFEAKEHTVRGAFELAKQILTR